MIHNELKEHSTSSLKDLPVTAKEESSSATDEKQEISLVLLVLSALSHQARRARMRSEVMKSKAGGRGEVKLVFLLAEPTSLEEKDAVRLEHHHHRDLLQISDPESYGRLAYKTLSGLIWTKLFCRKARFVAKTDDDALLDLDLLLAQLEAKSGGNFVSCPSVSRNFRPNRGARVGSLLAKWRLDHKVWLSQYLNFECIHNLILACPVVQSSFCLLCQE